jgi:hypothetical protein
MAVTLHEVSNLVHKGRHKLVRDLIPEHVNEFNAGGLQNGQIVNLLFL